MAERRRTSHRLGNAGAVATGKQPAGGRTQQTQFAWPEDSPAIAPEHDCEEEVEDLDQQEYEDEEEEEEEVNPFGIADEDDDEEEDDDDEEEEEEDFADEVNVAPHRAKIPPKTATACKPTPPDIDPEDDLVFTVPPAGFIVFLWVGVWATVLVMTTLALPRLENTLLTARGLTLPALNLGAASYRLDAALTRAAVVMAAVQLAILLLWRLSTRYTLTDEYLLVEKGLLGKRGWTVPLPDVLEIKYHRGLLGFVGGFGVMQITIAGQARPLRLEAFPGVVSATRIILAAKARHRRALKRADEQ